MGALVLAAFSLGVDLGRSTYAVATLASVCMVASAGAVAQSLSVGWLGHVGRISYSLYLWHVLTLRLHVPAVAGLALGLALAEVTYWLVDKSARGLSGRAGGGVGVVAGSDTTADRLVRR
jgi:peptidoglycan/LPS O-acetylase OafA/YrhL